MKTETKRLSLEDFKVKKIESKNEIDKLLGAAAASCHLSLITLRPFDPPVVTAD